MKQAAFARCRVRGSPSPAHQQDGVRHERDHFPCGQYRYALSERLPWRPVYAFFGVNPSG